MQLGVLIVRGDELYLAEGPLAALEGGLRRLSRRKRLSVGPSALRRRCGFAINNRNRY